MCLCVCLKQGSDKIGCQEKREQLFPKMALGIPEVCVCVCVCVQLLKLCSTLCDPMDHNTPSSLSMRFPRQEYWSGFVTPSSRGSSQPRDRFHISCIAGKFFTC